MSLTAEEKNKVMAAASGLTCKYCGGGDISAHDDGVTAVTQWGVSGAYVMCEDCGSEIANERK